MKRYRYSAVFIIILYLFALSGCSLLRLEPQIDHTSPDIRGVVSDLTIRGDNTGSMLVKGEKEADIQYSIASIGMNSKTRVFITDETGTHRAQLDDLVNGDTVAVLFTGPVAESYPVQATAGEIIIKR